MSPVNLYVGVLFMIWGHEEVSKNPELWSRMFWVAVAYFVGALLLFVSGYERPAPQAGRE